MKKQNEELEIYTSINSFAKAIGIDEPELALLHAKKKVISNLKKARVAQNLTQADLAKLAGTKQPAIARMEAGAVAGVSMDFLIKLAWVLKVNVTIKAKDRVGAA